MVSPLTWRAAGRVVRVGAVASRVVGAVGAAVAMVPSARLACWCAWSLASLAAAADSGDTEDVDPHARREPCRCALPAASLDPALLARALPCRPA